MVTKKQDAPAEEPGQEVEVRGTLDERVGDAGLSRYLQSDNTLLADSPQDAYRRIIQQIMSATTPQEILTPIDKVDAKDAIGRKLKLESFSLNRSEFEAGAPWFASMQCTDADSGVEVVVNTGHQGMMAQLMKLHEFNQYPYNVMVYEAGRPNENGGIPLRIKGW